MDTEETLEIRIANMSVRYRDRRELVITHLDNRKPGNESPETKPLHVHIRDRADQRPVVIIKYQENIFLEPPARPTPLRDGLIQIPKSASLHYVIHRSSIPYTDIPTHQSAVYALIIGDQVYQFDFSGNLIENPSES